jgi:hypothetical protein
MPTECTPKRFEFEAVARRAVVACFDGGDITSNVRALLLGQVDRGLGLMSRFAACSTDRRDPPFVEHQVETVAGQRIFGEKIGAGRVGGVGSPNRSIRSSWGGSVITASSTVWRCALVDYVNQKLKAWIMRN